MKSSEREREKVKTRREVKEMLTKQKRCRFLVPDILDD